MTVKKKNVHLIQKLIIKQSTKKTISLVMINGTNVIYFLLFM